ncbi:MAG: hypothetical protein ACE5GX_01110 [Thermoanaerobaculia bacterium]
MSRFLLLLVLATLAGGSLAQDQPSDESQGTTEEILGKRSSISFEAAPAEALAVAAGARLHVEPKAESAVLATVRVDLELEVLSRDGDWAEVRYQSWQGWVLASPEVSKRSLLDRRGWVVEVDESGTRRFAEAPTFSPELTAPRLMRLREFLAENERVLELGSYTLYTDVRNDSWLESLIPTVAALDEIYRTRFGLELDEAEKQSIVLFAREATYRAYEKEVPEISKLATLGHQSHGVAVTFVGSRSTDQIRRILLHELTHLLNRRALPLVLPSWLEEGLAEDLSFSRVDDSGRILAGTVTGRRQRTLTESRISGGFASLATLLRRYRRPSWPRVTTLVDTHWERFVQPGARTSFYTQAAFFLRFLIDGRDGLLADGFRKYLRLVAEEGPERADLWTSLDAPKEDIEKAYDIWIWNQGRFYGAVSERR